MNCDNCDKQFIDSINGLVEMTFHKLVKCESWQFKITKKDLKLKDIINFD